MVLHGEDGKEHGNYRGSKVEDWGLPSGLHWDYLGMLMHDMQIIRVQLTNQVGKFDPRLRSLFSIIPT